MPFKFSVGKCQKRYQMSIWPRFDQICEDNLKSKSIFSYGWMMEGHHIMGPDVFFCTKGMYAKFLVWFFTGMKMKIISNIFLSILWIKINNFNTFYWICASELPCLVKKNYFFYFMAVKDHTSDFADTSLCPDYFTSSNVVPHWTLQSALAPLKKSNFTKYAFVSNWN